MARTPEEVLETAYKDGLSVAEQHGFKLAYEVQRGESGLYFIYREDSRRPYQPVMLAEDDLGVSGDKFKWVILDEDGLKISADDRYIKVTRCAVLASEQGMATFVLGRVNLDINILNAPVLKMGVGPLTLAKDRRRYKMGVIPFLIDGNINHLSGSRAQISYEFDTFSPRFLVEGEASNAIPGLHKLDNNWLLEDNGRDALRGLVDDPFYQLERYQRLTPLGLQI